MSYEIYRRVNGNWKFVTVLCATSGAEAALKAARIHGGCRFGVKPSGTNRKPFVHNVPLHKLTALAC